MSCVLVEQTFDPPLTDEEHNRMGKLLDECLAARRAQWVRSCLSTDRSRMVCQFEAPDVESIREAYRSAGVTTVRIWGAELYERKSG